MVFTKNSKILPMRPMALLILGGLWSFNVNANPKSCKLPMDAYKAGDLCANDDGSLWKLVLYDKWSGAESWVGPDGHEWRTASAQTAARSDNCARPNSLEIQRFNKYGGSEISGFKHPLSICTPGPSDADKIKRSATGASPPKPCSEFMPTKVHESCMTKSLATFTFMESSFDRTIWKNEKTGEFWGLDSKQYTGLDAAKRCRSLGGNLASFDDVAGAVDDGIREINPTVSGPNPKVWTAASSCPDPTFGVMYTFDLPSNRDLTLNRCQTPKESYGLALCKLTEYQAPDGSTSRQYVPPAGTVQ